MLLSGSVVSAGGPLTVSAIASNLLDFTLEKIVEEPPPVEPEPAAMPGQDSLGFDDHEGASPARPQPQQPCPEDSVGRAQSGPSDGDVSRRPDRPP